MNIARYLPGVFAITLTLLAGCAATPDDSAVAELDDGRVVCNEPRPQVCTMEYRPVCAELKAGGSKDYASGCNACADIAVIAHRPNACVVP
ncbi:hypothetical protein NOR51B_385 [Luminiphilus syltensis NOR5-1B]|uniref:Kazal-like domain-containing protein n=1 Tax=Luminiphilus syltensis NOR5-1B TaxID=565045 RepID=B8KW28_9GAMM|nr:hypothetical protein [Luminiphilus syltensis]EED34448.1 hypothetical protein NOR51B_385 [Luminiphilus syltensis NOR5-1B]